MVGSVSPITHVTHKRNFLKKDIPFKINHCRVLNDVSSSEYPGQGNALYSNGGVCQLDSTVTCLVLFALITAAEPDKRSETTSFLTEQ